MTVKTPRDANYGSLPALFPDYQAAVAVSLVGTAAGTSGPIAAHCITLTCLVSVWVQGGEAPTATAGAGSMLLPAGIYTIGHTPGHRISALKANAGDPDTVLCITPAEQV